MNAEPIVTVEKLHKWFGLLHVLQGVSLSVMPREVVVAIGRSGSGRARLALPQLPGTAVGRDDRH
jgi:ABC-type polar amino acid transport system ATPase subunit